MSIGSAWENCLIEGSDVASLKCIPYLFQNVVTAALIFAGAIAVIIVIISGIKFITSSGDPKQVEGAKQTMTYAIIGLVLVLLSFVIVNFIGAVTGANCISAFGFDTCK